MSFVLFCGDWFFFVFSVVLLSGSAIGDTQRAFVRQDPAEATGGNDSSFVVSCRGNFTLHPLNRELITLDTGFPYRALLPNSGGRYKRIRGF